MHTNCICTHNYFVVVPVVALLHQFFMWMKAEKRKEKREYWSGDVMAFWYRIVMVPYNKFLPRLRTMGWSWVLVLFKTSFHVYVTFLYLKWLIQPSWRAMNAAITRVCAQICDVNPKTIIDLFWRKKTSDRCFFLQEVSGLFGTGLKSDFNRSASNGCVHRSSMCMF